MSKFKSGDKVKIVSLSNSSIGDAEYTIGDFATIVCLNDCFLNNDLWIKLENGSEYGISSEDVELIFETDKEYLTISNSGEYKLVNHRFTDVDIEVPDGAEMLTEDYSNTLTFWKDKDKSMNVGENVGWLNPKYDGTLTFYEYLSYGCDVLWKSDVCEDTETQEYDVVNKPKHYNSDPSGVQCIELTRCLSFDAGNALKYIWREGNKDASLQELKKAQWYVNDLIEYDVPIAIEGLGDTIEFEDKVKKVLATWSGWKYIFLNALYWNDKQEMKRAIDALVKEAETNC